MVNVPITHEVDDWLHRLDSSQPGSAGTTTGVTVKAPFEATADKTVSTQDAVGVGAVRPVELGCGK